MNGHRVRIARDLDECEALWRGAVPAETIGDLWEVRSVFQRHFRRPACFVVAEADGQVTGLLPLSWVEESQHYAYFPGETWEGKTWLEQNRIHAVDGSTLHALLAAIPGSYHLRYLLPTETLEQVQADVDEIGYLFHPPRYGFDFSGYTEQYSRKSLKKIWREVDALEERGSRYRHDAPEDFELLVTLNMSRFGERSYFHDPRFRASFADLVDLLREKGWLRITTVSIGGVEAAVDLGALYRGVYTLLAGGTRDDHPGVAKLINLHHIRRACAEQMEQVDFLCGDFNWKQRFHLEPRPLYRLQDLQ